MKVQRRYLSTGVVVVVVDTGKKVSKIMLCQSSRVHTGFETKRESHKITLHRCLEQFWPHVNDDNKLLLWYFYCYYFNSVTFFCVCVTKYFFQSFFYDDDVQNSSYKQSRNRRITWDNELAMYNKIFARICKFNTIF